MSKEGQENFYEYQARRTRILLVWGLGSTAIGLIGRLVSQQKGARQFWLQNFAWGAIDAAIAIFGLRSVNKKLAEAKPNPQKVSKDIRAFHRILFINTFLDIGYVFSGVGITRSGLINKEMRGGIGAGFIVQGLYLFIYDFLLARETKSRWLK